MEHAKRKAILMAQVKMSGGNKALLGKTQVKQKGNECAFIVFHSRRGR